MEEENEIPYAKDSEFDLCYAMLDQINVWLDRGWFVQKKVKNLPPGHVLVGKSEE